MLRKLSIEKVGGGRITDTLEGEPEARRIRSKIGLMAKLRTHH